MDEKTICPPLVLMGRKWAIKQLFFSNKKSWLSYLQDNLEGVPDNLEGVPENLDGVPGLGGLACCGTRLASEFDVSSSPAPPACCFLLAAIMARSPELAAAGRLLAATFFPGLLVFFFTLLLGTASVDKSGHKKNFALFAFSL